VVAPTTSFAGVFDPPPSFLTGPWPYLGGVVAVTVAAAGAAVAAALHQARRSPLGLLRAL
jgi:putative ABC transport system permease protein